MTATFRRRDLQYDHDLCPSRKQRVSCNHEVSNANNFYAISATSEFFTADHLVCKRPVR